MAVAFNSRLKPQIGTGAQRALGGGGGNNAQQASPAMDALRTRLAPTIGATSARGLGQQPNGPAPAGEPPRTDLATAATVDTSRTDQLYQDQLAQSNKDRDLMTQVGLNTISGLQTRNASNAARMGLQAGGASYLSGQRSAAIQGTNAFNQGLQQWGNQRQGIMSGQAGILSGAQGQNAAAQNQAGIFNAGREGQIDDREAAAQAEREKNQVTGDIGAMESKAKWYFDGGANGSFGANGFNDIKNQWTQAVSPEEKAAASAAAQNYLNALAQARMDYDEAKKKGIDGVDSFDEWKKKNAARYGIS